MAASELALNDAGYPRDVLDKLSDNEKDRMVSISIKPKRLVQRSPDVAPDPACVLCHRPDSGSFVFVGLLVLGNLRWGCFNGN